MVLAAALVIGMTLLGHLPIGRLDSLFVGVARNAEQFAEEDKQRREAAEAKNQAESLIHSTEQQIKEHGDNVDSALKGEIEAAVAEAKTAVESGDPEAMKSKTEALAQAAMKLGQAIYEKAQAAGGADAAAQSAEATAEAAPGDEEVVDAEFSEVDEDKKA